MSPFKLKPLPYKETDLEPYFSAETLLYHHGRHQKAYVDKLNLLLPQSPFADQSIALTDLILKSEGALFNQAAQVWNHEFYWTCLAPSGKGESPQLVWDKLKKDFDTIENFKSALHSAVMDLFGSGWVWLVFDPEPHILKLIKLSNADNPLRMGWEPILAIDVWEHAYYIDYRHQRGAYFEAVWQLINWQKLFTRLAQVGI